MYMYTCIVHVYCSCIVHVQPGVHDGMLSKHHNCHYSIIIILIVLSTTSSATIRLDISPYNNFTIQCILMYYPTNSAINVTFTYTDNNTNGDSVSNTTVSMDNPMINTQSINITSADENTVIQYEYICTVTVSATDAPADFTNSDYNSITVRGMYV